MNTRYKFILTAAVLVTSAVAIGITSAPPQTALAENWSCRSEQVKDVFTITTCFPDKEEVKILKESCKGQKKEGTVDKCSSSQTGFGNFPNFKQ